MLKMNSIFLVALPKAGILLSGIPVYISFLWGGFLSAKGFFNCLANLKRTEHLLIFLTGFWVTTIFIFNLSAMENTPPLAYARTLFLWSSMMTIFMWGARPLNKNGIYKSETLIRNAYVFIVVYGYLQLLFGPEAINLNGITSTSSGGIQDILNKNNVLHEIGVAKVFSTYQNGNLFGVALVTLLPVAARQITSTLKRSILYVMVLGLAVMTGSAATMLGLAVFFAITLVDWIRIGRIKTNYIIAFVFLLPLAFLVISQIDTVTTIVQNRLVGRDLSDNIRWVKFGMWVSDISRSIPHTLFGNLQPEAAIFEVLPAAMAQFFGVPAAIMFYLSLFVLTRLWQWSSHKIPIIVYLAMSIGEGGFWLTPSPFIFGLVVHLSYSRNQLLRNIPSQLQNKMRPSAY